MKMHATATKKAELDLKEKLTLGRLNLLYHVAVMTIVAILSATHFTTQFAVLAFVPMAVHAVYGTYKLSGKVRFKTLGLVLLGQSLVFAVLLGFFYG